MSFKGKIAIVTGAGSESGIGTETVIALAEKGCNVVAADLNFEGAEKLAAQVRALGVEAIAAPLDVTNEKSVQEMVDNTIGKFGRIDILVNNAGITQPVKTVDTTLADFMRIINVNLVGTFLCSKAAVKYMIAQKYGRIVNMSSVSAKRGGGVYGGSHYSAAKAGILGFSKALAREVVESGITVNSVCPGLVATKMRKGVTDEQERAMWEPIPMKRPATTREIAEAIAFLTSDAAAYITGEEIDINGGTHMD